MGMSERAKQAHVALWYVLIVCTYIRTRTVIVTYMAVCVCTIESGVQFPKRGAIAAQQQQIHKSKTIMVIVEKQKHTKMLCCCSMASWLAIYLASGGASVTVCGINLTTTPLLFHFQ